eukprot:g1845.t1
MKIVFAQMKEKRRSIIEPPPGAKELDPIVEDINSIEADQEILMDIYENEIHERKRMERKAIKNQGRQGRRRAKSGGKNGEQAGEENEDEGRGGRTFSVWSGSAQNINIRSLSETERNRRAAIIIKQLQDGARPNWHLLRNATNWRITSYRWHCSEITIEVPTALFGTISLPVWNWNNLVVIAILIHIVVVTSWEEKCNDRRDPVPIWPQQLEFLCLLVYLVDLLWELGYLGWHKFVLRVYKHFHNHGRNNRIAKTCIVLVMIVGFAVRVSCGYGHAATSIFSIMSKPLRPVLLMTRFRGLTNLVALVNVTCVKTADVFIVILATLILYTFASVALFSKCEAAGSSTQIAFPFSRFSYGLSELSVLLTNDNLLPLMKLDLCEKNHSSLFFFSFVIIVQMLLMNMVITAFWDSFKEFKADSIKRRLVSEKKALIAAFQLIKEDGLEAEIKEDEWREFMAIARPDLDDREAKEVFDLVDEDKSGEINLLEFLSMIDIICLHKHYEGDQIHLPPLWAVRWGLLDKEYEHDLQALHTSGGGGDGSVADSIKQFNFDERERLAAMGAQDWAARAHGCCLVLVFVHCFALLLMQELQVAGMPSEVVGGCFLTLHSVELWGKYQAIGRSAFLKHNKLDASLCVMAVAIAIIGGAVAEVGESAVQLALVLPAFRLFSVYRRMKGLMKQLFSVMPVLINVAMLEFILVLFYAIMGLQLFCGKVSAANTGGADFSKLWESFQTCFLLLMGEGTGVILFEALLRETNDDPIQWLKSVGVWVYFFSFQVITVWIVSNLFVGILDNVGLHRLQAPGGLRLDPEVGEGRLQLLLLLL